MSIRWRLTIFNALAIGAILLLLGIGLYLFLRQSLTQNVEDAVESQAAAAAADLRVQGAGPSPEVSFEREFVEQLRLDGVFLIVRDEDGNVLYESANLSRSGADAAWREALRGGEPASGTAPLSRKPPDYVYAVPITRAGAPPLVLETGRSYDMAHESLETVATALAVGFGAALLLSVVGAYLLARAALRPVDAVVSMAREMSESDLSRRLPVSNPNDEIGRLATTINGLLARLQAAFNRLEASLSRQEEALARQRRFAADASHELRTPLTAISGHANMLDDWALEDPKAAKKSVGIIKKESERMRSLAESLLALARGDEGPAAISVGRHDLGAVASEAAEAARAAAGGRVSVEYEPSEGPVIAAFDRDKVRQVATILLDNAVKYTPQGGSIVVRAGGEGETVFLEVSDTGAGIPEADLPLVFERFYRADAARNEGGAGLGLSIAEQIAASHGGRIEARSWPGHGSTFCLKLPASLREEARS